MTLNHFDTRTAATRIDSVQTHRHHALDSWLNNDTWGLSGHERRKVKRQRKA